ncbi:hypothetical protein ACOSQ3_010782 [Xanthoceras sorbifolium]
MGYVESPNRPKLRRWKKVAWIAHKPPSPGQKIGVLCQSSRRGTKSPSQISPEKSKRRLSPKSLEDSGGKRQCLGLFCVVVWAVWRERNCFLHSSVCKSVKETLEWAVNYCQEFQNTCRAISSALSLYSPSSQVSWRPPPFGDIKLNIDAAISVNHQYIEASAVLRDGFGSIVAALSKPFDCSFDPELGELLALRAGLLFAKQYHLRVEWVEVNAKNVVVTVCASGSSSGPAGTIIEDVRSLCEEVGVFKCQAISKLGNGIAHTLAALAFSYVKEHVWLDVVPNCVSSLL